MASHADLVHIARLADARCRRQRRAAVSARGWAAVAAADGRRRAFGALRYSDDGGHGGRAARDDPRLRRLSATSCTRLRYPAPGNPELARDIVARLAAAGVAGALEPSRGLDHGAWIPLSLMFPRADVPVLQVSIDSARSPRAAFRVGTRAAVAARRRHAGARLPAARRTISRCTRTRAAATTTARRRSGSRRSTNGRPAPSRRGASTTCSVTPSARRTLRRTTRRPSTTCRCS